ncbi:MAG TPA: radical SAM protein [Planctomycetota bacterium]|nr:radical SAM protein [Planctomycetota bacterium]
MSAPRKRKVRFIEPHGHPGRPLNVHIRRYPLLGPITLATILSQRGFDVSVYNENISGPLEGNDGAWADMTSADVVGISIMTPTSYRGYEIADRLRREAPGVTVVFGGAHATFMSDEAIEHGDIVVCGEAERIIEDIASGKIRSGIHRPERLDNLDELPTLDYSLMTDFDRLVAPEIRRNAHQLPLVTSRGCPYACTYCSVSRMFGRTVRRQSIDKVHRDLRAYASRGFRSFFIYDDNFTSDRTWTKALLDRIQTMHIEFIAQSRTDFHWLDAARTQLDQELLTALRRSGCTALLLGYETIDEASAKHWHKGYRGDNALVERLAEDTRILNDNNIWTYAMFVIGPQHTQDTIENVLQFAWKCKVASLQIAILTPFPGTPFFEEMRPHLVLDRFPGDWAYYDGSHAVYEHRTLGLEGLCRAVLDAHQRFYRVGGWGLSALKVWARRPGTAVQKLVDLYSRVRQNRGVFDRWSNEMEEFLAVVRKRKDGRET